jgi:hypothetical protein
MDFIEIFVVTFVPYIRRLETSYIGVHLREVEVIAEEDGVVFGREFALDRTTAMVVGTKWN